MKGATKEVPGLFEQAVRVGLGTCGPIALILTATPETSPQITTGGNDYEVTTKGISTTVGNAMS